MQGGYIRAATKHFAEVWNDPTADPSLKHMNAAVLAAADGDWTKATEELQKMLDVDPENFVVRICPIPWYALNDDELIGPSGHQQPFRNVSQSRQNPSRHSPTGGGDQAIAVYHTGSRAAPV